MKKLITYCTKALEGFAGLLLLVLTLMIFINVVLRYGFNSGITVTEELGRYLFVWLVFSGAILAAGKDQHVRVDMFVRKLPRIPQTLVACICDLIMIYCCYLIVSGGYRATLRSMNEILAVSKLPVGWLYLSGTLAGFFIGLILVVRLFGRIASLTSTPEQPVKE
jgi:TRAP-type C4-dicarboxylate transport system, small permease component